MNPFRLTEAQRAYDYRSEPDYDRYAELEAAIAAELKTADLFGWMNDSETAAVSAALDGVFLAVNGWKREDAAVIAAAWRLSAEFEAIRARAVAELAAQRRAEAAEYAADCRREETLLRQMARWDGAR